MRFHQNGENPPRKKYGDELLAAISKYCQYQERSHQEARDKLYALGGTPDEVEGTISMLISENILNEERFACSYARGKWRIKRWGKIKIVHSLKSLRVSDYCIKKALGEIDPDEYFDVLTRLTEKKWEELRAERSPQRRKSRVYSYLAGKGYESGLITEAIKAITDNQQ